MILKFINREEELKSLDLAWKSNNSEFFVVYGRRRVGKTELIKKFSKDKKHFYYLAKKQDLDLEKEEFQNKFSEKFNIFLGDNRNFEDLFSKISEVMSLKEKLIVVIDEFPYWIAKDESILSKFQYIWDEILKEKKIFLILCGSYVSVMEDKVLGNKSPLYGRRTGQLLIEPMKVKHIKSFLPKYTIEDQIKTFGAIGTIPFYLREFDDSQGFFDNIRETFLNKANILNKEADFLLRDELREINVYFNILKSIIDGATSMSEIADKSRVNITNINKYLNTLIYLKLIKKIKPITSSPKDKNYLYYLEDNYFRFWLSYIYPYQSEIEENPESVLKLIEKDYSNYIGTIFEDFCQKIIKKFDIKITKLGLKAGKWWYKNKEIDLVAINEHTTEILFGECKWKDNVQTQKILEQLKIKSKDVKWSNDKRKEYFVLFAKSFNKKIKEKNVYCFDLKDIERVIRK